VRDLLGQVAEEQRRPTPAMHQMAAHQVTKPGATLTSYSSSE
jgi:hypothetical protein